MRISKNSFLAHVFIVAGLLLVSLVLAAQAVSKDDIAYPIGELDNCRNEKECHAYCDARDNLQRVQNCIGFAKKHNLLPPEELKEAEYYVIARGITEGPGGCKNQQKCDEYCEDTARIDECLDFAQTHNLQSADQIADGRKVAKALKEGASLPGGCRTRSGCETYCDSPSNMRECVDFAKKSGLISQKEAQEAEKIIPLIEKGEKTPGNCARKEACEAYCYEPSHIDECLAFAEKAGLIPAQELSEAKKIAPFIKSGQTPGRCLRKAECEAYCSDTAHFEECIAFGEKAGLMNKEDLELARKTKGAGPGGCRSRESCEEFCRNPENQESCLHFAKEHGITEEFSGIEQEARAKSEAQIRACYENPCKEMIACLQGVAEHSGGAAGDLPPDIGAKLDSCIAEISKGLQKDAGGEHPAATRKREPADNAAKEDQQQSEEQYKQEYQKQYDETAKQYCHLFEAAPKCEYAAPPGSDNYNLCKKCFPEK